DPRVRHRLNLFTRRLRSGISVNDLLEQNVYIRIRLLHGDSRFETRNYVERLKEVVLEAVPSGGNLLLHGQWNPHIWRLADDCAKEAGRGHADDCVSSWADRDSGANRRRIAREPPLPPRIAGDRYGMPAGGDVISGGKGAAEERIDLEGV